MLEVPIWSPWLSIFNPLGQNDFLTLFKWIKVIFESESYRFLVSEYYAVTSCDSDKKSLSPLEVDQNADTPIYDLKWPVTIIINHFISESWILIACSSLKIPRKNNFKLSTKFLGWSNRGFCTSGRLVRSYQDWNIWLKGRVLFSFKFQLFVHIYINYVNNLNILFILI